MDVILIHKVLELYYHMRISVIISTTTILNRVFDRMVKHNVVTWNIIIYMEPVWKVVGGWKLIDSELKSVMDIAELLLMLMLRHARDDHREECDGDIPQLKLSLL